MRVKGKAMQKHISRRCRNHLWPLAFGLFVFWLAVLYFYHSVSIFNKKNISLIHDGFENSVPSRSTGLPDRDVDTTKIVEESENRIDRTLDSTGHAGRSNSEVNSNVDEKQPGREGSDSVRETKAGVKVTTENEWRSSNEMVVSESENKQISTLSSVENTTDTREFSASSQDSEVQEDDKTFNRKDSSDNEKGASYVQDLGSEKKKLAENGGRLGKEMASNGNEIEIIESSPKVEGRTSEDNRRQSGKENLAGTESNSSCAGQYIYIHDIPSKFNKELLENCRTLSPWDKDFCPVVSNMGLGIPLPNSGRVFSNTGWFITNQFNLEIIFHNRMKEYRCLTNDSSLASAIYVPYYAGLDVGRYLWGSRDKKDVGSLELVRWLRERREWKRMWGKDHFLVAGRTSWDFSRPTDNVLDWGNKLLFLPEVKNTTVLVIEPSPWSFNEYGIPYPTYFHPSKDIEVQEWQNRMRSKKRRNLFTFVGGPRPDIPKSARAEIMEQCKAAKNKCALLDCSGKGKKCYKPALVMRIFQDSMFCLQPMGDSYTRRSAFDTILAGCIPVFFHPGSAYIQYLWHLPRNYEKYSVYIPSSDIKNGTASIERILQQIPNKKVMALREEVIKLIPRIIYANPRGKLENLEDAFDIAVERVLSRVEKLRKEVKEGKDPTSNIDEELAWKYKMCGNVKEHEWDGLINRHTY